MLLYEFLEPMGISQIQFVKHIGWYYARLNEIINGKRGVSADSALAFFEALGTHPEFWLNLSRNRDLWQAKKTHIHVRFLKIYMCLEIIHQAQANRIQTCSAQ
jgi:addiction module HigA family antidote